MGALYVRSRTLLAPMLLHSLWCACPAFTVDYAIGQSTGQASRWLNISHLNTFLVGCLQEWVRVPGDPGFQIEMGSSSCSQLSPRGKRGQQSSIHTRCRSFWGSKLSRIIVSMMSFSFLAGQCAQLLAGRAAVTYRRPYPARLSAGRAPMHVVLTTTMTLLLAVVLSWSGIGGGHHPRPPYIPRGAGPPLLAPPAVPPATSGGNCSSLEPLNLVETCHPLPPSSPLAAQQRCWWCSA